MKNQTGAEQTRVRHVHPPHLATNPDLDGGLLAGPLGVPAGGDESHRMRFLGEGVVVLPF